MTQNIYCKCTNLVTNLHVAGFEAFVQSDEASILTNCPTEDFICCGMVIETGLVIVPHTYPGTQTVDPDWYVMRSK
jgi:hypothetical protein